MNHSGARCGCREAVPTSFVSHSLFDPSSLSCSLSSTQHVTHPHSYSPNRSFPFPTNASTPVPLLASLLICNGPPRAASHHIHHAHTVAEYTHAARTPATNVLDTLEKNKIEHLSKSPLGVRVMMMYRNVLCSFIRFGYSDR
jgi:hypothetical protein